MSQTDDILGQFYIAFGHGVGSLRVSRAAAARLRDIYRPVIERDLASRWDEDEFAGQVLERVRAVGRRAAHEATLRADTSVSDDDVSSSALAVSETSKTPWCPPE